MMYRESKSLNEAKVDAQTVQSTINFLNDIIIDNGVSPSIYFKLNDKFLDFELSGTNITCTLYKQGSYSSRFKLIDRIMKAMKEWKDSPFHEQALEDYPDDITAIETAVANTNRNFRDYF